MIKGLLMKIEHTISPNNKDVDFLTKKINEETSEHGAAHTFGFFLRDEIGNIIAGCNGAVIYGAIYTDQLWVHSAYRKLGLGKKFMEEVHQYGKKVGCSLATVSTMNFQHAKPFYEKLGYKCDFELFGYANYASCFFLSKKL
jgi:GNAT superfamily N-acetyltransferase